jgi:hypothetical protein
MNNNSIYTEQEEEDLKKINKVRSDIIEDMTKEHVPKKTSDIRVLNEVMASFEKSIIDTANIRLKAEDTQNQTLLNDSIVETLKEVSRINKITNVNRDIDISDDYIPDVVKGQTDIHPDKLEYKDFIQEEK